MHVTSQTAPAEAGGANDGLRLLMVALAVAVLYHGGLLPFTHGNTYDAFIHMFFGDHYHRSWFDPWEPRWYTGFATTSYPPGTHMAMGALMHVMPLRAAFVVVMVTGLLLLTTGVYRFALMWVAPRAAGYAAIALVLSSSVSETIHLFGQLPTIFSLGVFLNGLPYVYRWISQGGWSNFAAAVIFSAATTAAHHVTTIFGGVLFVIPLALQALRAAAALRPMPHAALPRRLARFVRPFARGILLAVCMIAAVALTVLPYWLWSVSDPITQVPIPHGSRESFIERPDLGFVFFVLPWGAMLLVLPYALYKTATTRLWPLGLSVMLCFVLGTGGTTPIPRAILHGAFDILTLDRFTYWATILILPFTGLMLDGLLHGRAREALRAALGPALHRLIAGGFLAALAGVSVFAAVLPAIQPLQPRFVDPAPIVQFLESDEHDRWRYLTLGFGDQFAYLSAQTTAQSVDGNYHSARRLPDMTRFSVERLENAKYLGVPGLGSLRQFLVDAERYNLKYVFSNDAFYDPLLHFTGWTRLNRLQNGIVVWEKPDIPPLPLFQSRREIPALHTLMWGLLPPTALLTAAAMFAASLLRRTFGTGQAGFRPVLHPRPGFPSPRRVRLAVVALLLIGMTGAGALTGRALEAARKLPGPDTVVLRYLEHLDFRRFGEAYALLDPETRGSFEEVMFNWRWTGGLLASYGKLDETALRPLGGSEGLRDWEARLTWLTALGAREETRQLRTVQRGGQWFVAPVGLRPVQTPVRLQRQAQAGLNVVGRRQPRADTDLHRDRLDRPRIFISQAHLVMHEGRYAVVGQITNADADPAAVTVRATLTADNAELATRTMGSAGGHRLRPAASAGFRTDFDGVLSLEDAEAAGAFDPTLFIPPQLDAAPEGASIEARALVASDGLYDRVALNGIRMAELPDGRLELRGTAVNTGTETASITRISALLHDPDGRAVWTGEGYTRTNITPGQSAPFRVVLPPRDAIEVIAPVTKIITNGAGMQADTGVPGAGQGTLPLNGLAGYGAVRLHVSSMTHDPLF